MEVEKEKTFKINWYVVALILILVFAFAVRFYFFSLYKNQPVWWDESEHLVMAKHIAFGTPLTGWNATREIIVPLIFAFFFKLFHSEVAVRFSQLLFSMGIVFMTYLVGKEIFNKKIGLIAAFLMSVFYLNLFFTLRLGLEIIGPFFSLLTVYYFWKGYIKKEKQKIFIPLMAVFGVLAFMTNAKEGLLLISLFLFLLFTDKFKFLKNKHLWLAILIGLIVLAPYMLYYYHTVGHPLPRLMTQTASVQARLSEGGWNWNNFFSFPKFFTVYLQWPFFIIFLIGLFFILISLSLGFDLMLKEQAKKNSKYLFLILWAALPLITFSYFLGQSPGAYMEPRFMLEIFPAVFLITSNGFLKIYDWLKSYGKITALIVIILILFTGTFYQLRFGNITIKSKATSYLQVKEAALWMKENSQGDDWIISASVPQTTYYSERSVQGVGMSMNETEFNKIIQKLKPKFMTISAFEPHPKWYYEWPQKHTNSVKVVQAYTTQQNGQQKPLLVIYEFLNYDF